MPATAGRPPPNTAVSTSWSGRRSRSTRLAAAILVTVLVATVAGLVWTSARRTPIPPELATVRFVAYGNSSAAGLRVALLEASNRTSGSILFGPFATVLTESNAASGTHAASGIPLSAVLGPHQVRTFSLTYSAAGNAEYFQLFCRPWRGRIQEGLDDLWEWARSRGFTRRPGRNYLAVECGWVRPHGRDDTEATGGAPATNAPP